MKRTQRKRITELFKTNPAFRITFLLVLTLVFNSIVVFIFMRVAGLSRETGLFFEFLFYAEMMFIIPYITYVKPLLGLYSALFIEISIKNIDLGPGSIRTVILIFLIGLYVWNEVIKKRKTIAALTDPIIKYSLFYVKGEH